MPRKALKNDGLAYLTMLVCYELGKTEEEVKSWTLDNLFRWIAFFHLKGEAEAKAAEQAKNRRSGKKSSNVQTY